MDKQNHNMNQNINQTMNQSMNQTMEEWYKINKCSDEAKLFMLCIKNRDYYINPPHDTCKYLFNTWFKCINQ